MRQYEELVTVNSFKPISGLGYCPFYGGGYVAVDLLFIVAPIVCGASVCYVVHSVLSSLVSIPDLCPLSYFAILLISTFPAKHLKKTNTSVPNKFQGLLNIEGIWVQYRVSPELFNILL